MKKKLFSLFPELSNIPAEKFPRHVVFIPDGNRRWAKQKGKSITEGHIQGAKTVINLIRELKELTEIKILTMWGFSSDNWKRGSLEISAIFFLIQNQINQMLTELKNNNVRFVHIGRKDRIPKKLLNAILKAEKETENNNGHIICLAVDFGGEDQEIRILEKARLLPKDIKITTDTLWDLRDAHGIVPSADLLIRTSGENRTSDIGWLNGAPTELYFIDKFLPDVTIQDIVQAIIAYSKRDRRLGGNKNI